jgi:hypothetical protein
MTPWWLIGRIYAALRLKKASGCKADVENPREKQTGGISGNKKPEAESGRLTAKLD